MPKLDFRPIPPLTEKHVYKLFDNIRVDVITECWEWLGYVNPDNEYGQFSMGQEHFLVHRVSYTHIIGPIPDGLVLDHLCRFRRCANPWHAEPITNKENILRGEGPSARQARQTHCEKGHPLEGDNLKITPSGKRRCRECIRIHKRSPEELERQRQHYWANRESESLRQKANYLKRKARQLES